jgi:hypothetical protein
MSSTLSKAPLGADLSSDSPGMTQTANDDAAPPLRFQILPVAVLLDLGTIQARSASDPTRAHGGVATHALRFIKSVQAAEHDA